MDKGVLGNKNPQKSSVCKLCIKDYNLIQGARYKISFLIIYKE